MQKAILLEVSSDLQHFSFDKLNQYLSDGWEIVEISPMGVSNSSGFNVKAYGEGLSYKVGAKRAIEGYAIAIIQKSDESIINKSDLNKEYFELFNELRKNISLFNELNSKLREEQLEFFKNNLKDVTETLSKTDVNTEIKEKWINEFSTNYLKSLSLAEEIISTNLKEGIQRINKKFEDYDT